MKKILYIFTACFFFFLLKIDDVQASVSTEGVYYDLVKGGTQEFVVPDDSGHDIYILVEEVPSISLFSVNNGSYRISGKKTGLWEASYYINVANGNITNAYSPSVTAITGSFSSTYLGLDSSKQATYYLGWKMGILNYNHYLRASISNDSLKITY